MVPPQGVITICLHRLRTGHYYLNSFKHRVDKEAYPNRRKGCETIENAKDILIDSPATKNYRKKIRQFLANRNVNIDVDTQI